MKITLRKAAGYAVAVVSALAVGGWVFSSGHTHSDSEYLFAHLHARSGSADAVWMESSLAEMLPSRQFSVNGAPAAARTSGVAVGRITDVRPGNGFAHPDDAPSSVAVGFNGKDVLWRTIEVTLTIEEAWGRVAGKSSVAFAIVIDRGANAHAAMKGLRSLGTVIVALDPQGRYAYAPELYSISHSGDVFGTVDPAGTIHMPVKENGARFMNGLDTVAELRAEAVKAPQTIRVTMTDGLPARD